MFLPFKHMSESYAQVYLDIYFLELLSDLRNRKWLINFTSDKNCRKLSKWVENIAGKTRIARYQQFSLFPYCFEQTCTADT